MDGTTGTTYVVNTLIIFTLYRNWMCSLAPSISGELLQRTSRDPEQKVCRKYRGWLTYTTPVISTLTSGTSEAFRIWCVTLILILAIRSVNDWNWEKYGSAWRRERERKRGSRGRLIECVYWLTLKSFSFAFFAFFFLGSMTSTWVKVGGAQVRRARNVCACVEHMDTELPPSKLGTKEQWVPLFA